ncbi:MAG: inorganic phosphate transporter [Gemmataceae bacterium]
MSLWDALATLPTTQVVFFIIALLVAFGFEFVNGFHDTANAVTTVIYTKTLPATPAVLFSGFMNFLGVLFGGTAVAFGIVHLLPVDLLVESSPTAALVMVLALLLSALMWNLGTWYLGLPVSSSHTLIGSILGVGIAHGLLVGKGLSGVNWAKASDVGLALILSPIFGFVVSALLLLLMKRILKDPRLYLPPDPANPEPPKWIRGVLISTCGAVSFAHGSNDGQKGMGLILLVLVGFLPFHYALNQGGGTAEQVLAVMNQSQKPLDTADSQLIREQLQGKSDLKEVPEADRWRVRQALYRTAQTLPQDSPARGTLEKSVEFVPFWVVLGVAVALGVGTTVGYKRIVITVAEKIGKTHLTYAQGAAAETVAAMTILLADLAKAPVSTTQVLSSGIAGTMTANNSGIQGGTVKKILLAWLFTLPSTLLLAGLLFTLGHWIVG